MRKLMNIFAAALVMLAAVGCEKNETLPDNSSKVITLSATINNGDTKTSLGEWDSENNEYPVLWSANDAIAVINNGTLFKFVVDAEDAGTTHGTFTLEVFENCGYTAEDFDAAQPVQAFYPYDGVTFDGTTISYAVPATQTYQVKSFAQGTMPMAGYAANASGTVSFENLFGVVKLQLKGVADEKVESIEITSSNAVSGTSELTITESNNTISLSGTDAADKKVVLNCGTDGVALNAETATDFLIAVPAGATGLKILVNTTEESYYKEVPTENSSSEQINTVTAGKILKMPELTTTDMAPAYIENGVCYGGGIALPKSATETIIWAPVNCGYDENHKYGLLYQWGRKYGQGYKDEMPAALPKKSQLTSAADGSLESYKKNFYYGNSDWLTPDNDNLWYNSDPAATTTKTEYDPCPEGWRVPTNAELGSLVNGSSPTNGQWVGSKGWNSADSEDLHYGLRGFWFYGNTPETDGTKVFFPAAGYRDYVNPNTRNRNEYGFYWSSSVTDKVTRYLFFNFNSYVSMDNTDHHRAYGRSVRCVKDAAK